LASIGVDQSFTSLVEKTLPPGSSAVMVVATGEALDRIIGIFRGLRARIARSHLVGENQKQWLEKLAA
jgi:uncharacterized membrane protein